MTAPALTSDQNILPVQAYFNIDGSFNTFIGQGHPFVVSATESIGINNVTTNATFYPVFSPVSSGQVTSLDVFTGLTYNPSTGLLTTTALQGNLKGIADLATNLVGSYTNALVYQSTNNTTSFIANGTTGQYLSANTIGAPTWVTPTFAGSTVTDDTSTNATRYPLFSSITSGNLLTEYTSSTKYQFNPNTGALTATSFVGSGASLTSIPNGALVNSSITVGTTAISLGSSSTTLAGLSSVTSTTFLGALTGNASSATTATSATVALNVQVTDSTSSSSTFYPTLSPGTTGSTNYALGTSSTKLSFVPNTGTLTTTALVSTGGSIDNTPIGATTANTGKFTTLEATGTSTLGDASTTYIQVLGDASYPAIKAAGGTNTPLVLQPLGTGALQAQKTDSTATGGNARGANAVDWQTSRNAAAQVASGVASVIAGGGNYGGGSAGNTASGTAVFVGGGWANTASVQAAVIAGGNNNTASNVNASILGGSNNAASGVYSSAISGQANTAAGYYNFIGGGFTNSGTSGSAVTTQSATIAVTAGTTLYLTSTNANIKVGQLLTGTGVTSYTYATSTVTTGTAAVMNTSTISGTTLTVGTLASGTIIAGMVLTGTGVTAGTYIVSGSGSSWTVSTSQTVASTTITGTAYTFTISQAATTAAGVTLSFYTPHGVVVGGGNNQASGSYSFIGGGGDAGVAANRNVASGDWSVVVGGQTNTATTSYSFIGGGSGNNITSNTYGSIIGGQQNTVSNYASTVLGGYKNTASGNASIAGGYQSTTRAINTAVAFCGAQFSALGDSQYETFILSATTTNATITELYSLYNSSPNTTSIPILPAPSASTSSVYTFRGLVSAKDTATTNAAGWEIKGVIQRTGAGVGTVALVGTPSITLLGANAGAISAGWGLVANVTVTADTTNGGISVNVTGAASTTIRWNCRLDTSELG